MRPSTYYNENDHSIRVRPSTACASFLRKQQNGELNEIGELNEMPIFLFGVANNYIGVGDMQLAKDPDSNLKWKSSGKWLCDYL